MFITSDPPPPAASAIRLASHSFSPSSPHSFVRLPVACSSVSPSVSLSRLQQSKVTERPLFSPSLLSFSLHGLREFYGHILQNDYDVVLALAARPLARLASPARPPARPPSIASAKNAPSNTIRQLESVVLSRLLAVLLHRVVFLYTHATCRISETNPDSYSLPAGLHQIISRAK